MLWLPWEWVFNNRVAHYWRGKPQLTYAGFWLVRVNSRLATFVGATASTHHHLWLGECGFYWIFLWYSRNMRVLSVSLHEERHFVSCNSTIWIVVTSLSLPRKLLEVKRGQKSWLLTNASILWAERNLIILVFLNSPWAFELVINDNLLFIIYSVVLWSNLVF